MGRAVFGERRRASVDIVSTVLHLLMAGHVEMTVQKERSLLHGRENLLVEQMPVGGKQRASVCVNEGVVGKDREGEHHLVHLAVAVAAHRTNGVLVSGELRNYLLGSVLVGQGVARTVRE